MLIIWIAMAHTAALFTLKTIKCHQGTSWRFNPDCQEFFSFYKLSQHLLEKRIGTNWTRTTSSQLSFNLANHSTTANQSTLDVKSWLLRLKKEPKRGWLVSATDADFFGAFFRSELVSAPPQTRPSVKLNDNKNCQFRTEAAESRF